MNDRKTAIFDCVRSYIKENGYSPTVREICEELNIPSTSEVHMAIHRLVKQGKMTMVPGRARTLQVVETDEDIVRQGIAG